MADGSRVHNVRGVLAMQDSKNKMAAVKVAGKISAGLVFRVCYTVRVPTTNCHSGKSEHRNVGASERNLNPNPPCCYGAQERETRALHISYCTLCTVSVFDNIIMYRVHWSKQAFYITAAQPRLVLYAVCCMTVLLCFTHKQLSGPPGGSSVLLHLHHYHPARAKAPELSPLLIVIQHSIRVSGVETTYSTV